VANIFCQRIQILIIVSVINEKYKTKYVRQNLCCVASLLQYITIIDLCKFSSNNCRSYCNL